MRLVMNPDRFFEELKQREIKIRVPLLIVLAIAVITSAYQYLLMSKLAQAFPAELAKFLMIGAYIGIIGSFIGMFAVWMINAAIIHVISALFGGKGSFRRTFEFVGYGFLPSLIGSLITVSISAYFISQAHIPAIDVGQLQNKEAMKALMLSIIPKDLLYSNLMINAAVTVWSLTIWTFAIKHAREIPTKKAFVSVLIPTAVFGLYQIYSIMNLL